MQPIKLWSIILCVKPVLVCFVVKMPKHILNALSNGVSTDVLHNITQINQFAIWNNICRHLPHYLKYIYFFSHECTGAVLFGSCQLRMHKLKIKSFCKIFAWVARIYRFLNYQYYLAPLCHYSIYISFRNQLNCFSNISIIFTIYF